MRTDELIPAAGFPPAPPGCEWWTGAPVLDTATARVAILPNSVALSDRTSDAQSKASARQSPTATRSDRVLLCPWGNVRASNGNFVLDAESGQMVLEAFRAQGVDLPVDFEHQTLGGEHAGPDGVAPAAGWIGSLDAVPGLGLFANVWWTPKGQQAITAKEYKYLSPAVMVRKSDGRVSALHSVALTNKPAIAGAVPIINRQLQVQPTTGAAVLACSGTGTSHPARTPEQAWQANADLRAEFGGDKNAYLAYCKAEAAGLVRICGLPGHEPATVNRGGIGTQDQLLIGVNAMASVDDLTTGIVPELRKVMALAMNDESDLKAMLEVAVSLLTKALIQSDRGGNREAVEAALAVMSTVQEWMADDQRLGTAGMTAGRAAIRNKLRVNASRMLTRAMYGQPGRLGEEWQTNSALRQEFGGDQNAYLAYCKAEAAGQARIICAADKHGPKGPCAAINPSVEPKGQWEVSPVLRAEFGNDYGAFEAYWQQIRRKAG